MTTSWTRMPSRRRGRRDRGMNILEVVGLVIVSVMVIVGVGAALGVPLPSGLATAVCNVTGGNNCDEIGTPTAAPVPSGTSTPCEAFCPGPDNPMVPTDPTVAATKGNYVALGDSYSSGEGAVDYDDKSKENGCHRSANAYSQHIGSDFEFQGDKSFVACSGAVTDDFFNKQKADENPQLTDSNLSDKTTLVTLSIGGNDLGFADVITKCATDLHISWPPWEKKQDQCHAQEGNIRQKMKELFGPPEPSKYTKTLEAVHKEAKNARIIVTGYPQLFPTPPEHNWQNFKKEDQEFLNKIGAEVNEKIRERVEALDRKYYGHGEQKMGSFEFVDPSPSFKGHEASNLPWDDPWIHPIWVNCQDGSANWEDKCVNPGSFHPTAEGQKAMADVINKQIRNGPGRTLYDP
ncbi:MAG: hypothetical protein GEV11_09740 [Streptosporangiales bacterium]|nr:hypothetical protein [Streptosporangiales bacterium]